METQPPSIPIPAPPPFALATDLEAPDEHDVDLADDDELHLPLLDPHGEDTRVEVCEFMGEGYRSLAHYFVSQLEDHIAGPAQWILTTLDMAAVQRRFEAQRYRYVIEKGAVYRVGLAAALRPPPGDDPPGPVMPTRGC